MRKNTVLLVLFILGSFGIAMAEDRKIHEEQIHAVVEKFRLSIINKDKETFKSLFYDENIPQIVVFTDEMLNRKRKEKPDYPRTVNFGKFGSPVKMISDEDDQEEKMWNIEIETNGYLGSVHFDYSDHENGIRKAFGTEAWDLVKKETGWKIISIMYTVTEVEQGNTE